MTEALSPTPSLEIAHVLFIDVVAYSTLHMDRQRQILHDLQAAVRSAPTFVDSQAADHLISLPTGDGMALVFFHDPEAPARCALELAKALCSNPDIKVRMGIHTGPVYRVTDINANRNVAGGGINIAQRVMDCGDAGHILISKAMVDVLGQLTCWGSSLHDLGETSIKHSVRLHLFNFYTEEVGNPNVPSKIRTARVRREQFATSSSLEVSRRGVARGLFCLIQVCYLVMYVLLWLNFPAMFGAIGEVEGGDWHYALSNGWFFLVSVLGIPLRLYFLTLVVVDSPETRRRFQWLYVLTLSIDIIWAFMPLMLINRVGGLALPLAACFAFLPFAQRRLVYSAYLGLGG